jgi:hypothetical protein
MKRDSNKKEIFVPACRDDRFITKELEILDKNKRFFSTNYKYLKEMLTIIKGESEISIRILDWFVANYSKKNDIFYKIKINGREELFSVNNEYKNQLSGYSKMYFDPFCRKKKVIYTYKRQGKKPIIFISSIGQLNFFQWALKNKVIKYVLLHLKEIEQDMKETVKHNKEMKKMFLSDKKEKEELFTPNPDPDPTICSSDSINSIVINSNKKSPKSDSSLKYKRQQLCKSIYDKGIRKMNVPIKLDFD